MADRFEMRRTIGGMPAGLQPLIGCTLGLASRGQMVRQEFRLALDEISEMLFQRRHDPGVQFLASSAHQRAIGGVLHQRVLKQVGSVRSRTTTKQQSRVAELSQGGLQLTLSTLRYRRDQLMGKLAAKNRPDLGDLLRRWPELVQASHQRGMQRRRHRLRRNRCRRQNRGNPISRRGAFQYRLGQFFDKERHPVGALDDLSDDIGGKRGITG